MNIKHYIHILNSFCFLILSASATLKAQELDYTITLEAAIGMTVDDAGNVFIAQADKSVKKWNSEGDSIGEFRQVQYGAVSYLDATNPLELLVLYADFNRMLILDRLMSPKLNIDFSKLGLYNTRVAAQSMDGKFWVFDQNANALKKFDQSFQLVIQSNDFRMDAGVYLQPTQLLERNSRVVLMDSLIGFVIMDRFGNFIELLNHTGAQWFQLLEDQLIWWDGDQLRAYHFVHKQLVEVSIPRFDKMVGLQVVQDKLYICTTDALRVYKL